MAPELTPGPPRPTSVLEVRNLCVSGSDEKVKIVDEVSLSLAPGRKLGVVGESGSGKTTVALALLAFARRDTVISRGAVRVGDTDMLQLDERGRRRRRGRDIAYVPQDPATALSPGMRVGAALAETLTAHDPTEPDKESRVRRALREAQLPDDDEFRQRYPHQLSGGQQQRVAIAHALICRPSVIVMDEPTTGVDVTTQARLLEVVQEIIDEQGISLVLVTHDLGVVRQLVDEVAVMYGGRIVETGPVDEVFTRPRHPYTRRLLEAVPRVSPTAYQPREIPGSAIEPWDWPPGCPFAGRCDYRTDECAAAMPEAETPSADSSIRCFNWRTLPARSVGLVPMRVRAARAAEEVSTPSLLEVRNLEAGYGKTAAVSAVSFEAPRGACTAIVGESGSGKTTTLRCIAGLHEPTAGTISLLGMEMPARSRSREVDLRRRIQLVPQNPDASLNPRRTVGEIVGRPLRQFFGVRGSEQRARTAELLARVSLPPAMAFRFPRELSGGQRQRVAIARALAAEPELLLCDEVVAALDVAVQAGILALLDELRAEFGTTIVFVSHDLAVVRSISAHVVVMAQGRVREVGPTERIFDSPTSAYTQALLAAVPDLRPSDYPGDELRSVPRVPVTR